MDNEDLFFEDIPDTKIPEKDAPKENIIEERITATNIEYAGHGLVKFDNSDTGYYAHYMKYTVNTKEIDGKPAIFLQIVSENTKKRIIVSCISYKKFLTYDKNKKYIDNFLDNFEQWKAESIKEDKINNLRADFQNDIINPIETPNGVLLTKNEFVVLYDPTSTFSQERTKTMVGAAGTSFRVTKGMSFRVGGAAPIKEEYIARLDAGRLVLTNKKITFTGSSKTASIPLSKIVNIERRSNAIIISKDGNQKRFFFTDIEGELWADAIEAIFRVNNSE